MTKLANPVPLFLDGRGALLDAGYVYVGQPNTDPTILANQLSLYWDQAQTIAAAQPLRTLGGVIMNGGNTGFVFFTETDYSITINDQNGVLVSYTPSLAESAGPVYQPLDVDLTSIAAQANTPYGLGLLTLANTAALKAATGIPDCLPLTGGTVSGAITRSGAGNHVYYSGTAFTGARITGIDPSGTADSTSQPGDMQFFY